MHAKGFDVSVVLEGQSPSLLKEITQESDPLFPLYNKAKSKGSSRPYAMAARR
jgi:hypothetical protein